MHKGQMVILGHHRVRIIVRNYVFLTGFTSSSQASSTRNLPHESIRRNLVTPIESKNTKPTHLLRPSSRPKVCVSADTRVIGLMRNVVATKMKCPTLLNRPYHIHTSNSMESSDHSDQASDAQFTRRDVLSIFPAIAGLPLVDKLLKRQQSHSWPECVVVPQQTEGPFFADVELGAIRHSFRSNRRQCV